MQEATSAISQMRFPQKLWYLLDLHTDAILWGGTGRTILLNYRVLHNYLQCDHSIFKTTNISSFIRQLNLYGFRKVTSHLQDPLCNSSNPYMHEYTHDYFQYGRPELLNKITRKALTMKRSFKTKTFETNEQLLYISPLQKARRALRIALKKAAQDLLVLDSSKTDSNPDYEVQDAPDDFCEEEDNIELDWLIPKSQEDQKQITVPDPVQPSQEENTNDIQYSDLKDTSQDSLIDFSDTCHQNHDSFPGQFLNMPDLDSDANNGNCGVQLLAEFNIGQDAEQDIARMSEKIKNHSLNCVLPSVSNDSNDDNPMNDKHNDSTNLYHGEWDQMFNDIMTNKASSQEGVSNLRELYSQISQTIDLLNS
ncbi:uncharacterized protein LOC116779851 [Danaus plexippus]|uniref:uncharacterized protein LOC116779851 n=1 Tax=Danaus plexippus TaxID=13037 RepID=UPI002AB2058E|nr:uncharacterized protein LOC116779851 [Danaus plexippus]